MPWIIHVHHPVEQGSAAWPATQGQTDIQQHVWTQQQCAVGKKEPAHSRHVYKSHQWRGLALNSTEQASGIIRMGVNQWRHSSCVGSKEPTMNHATCHGRSETAKWKSRLLHPARQEDVPLHAYETKSKQKLCSKTHIKEALRAGLVLSTLQQPSTQQPARGLSVTAASNGPLTKVTEMAPAVW